MRCRRWPVWGLVLLAASLALPVTGLQMVLTAAPAGAVVDNFADSTISAPYGITLGPDGAFWFVNLDNNSIGRVDTEGTVTNFPDLGISAPLGIAAGSDGALWFTNWGDNRIGRITTAGAFTYFTDSSISNPKFITAGPDGALWFTNDDNNSIGRIDTSGSVTNFTDASINLPGNITTGPDGALWFANQIGDSIERITTGGAVTNFTDTSISHPNAVAPGPDGALWFTNSGNNSIGRITTAGAVTNFTDTSIAGPDQIAVGPDGALWFTNLIGDSIGRIDPVTHAVSNFTDANVDGPYGIVAGPDGAMWFTNINADSIGRVSQVVLPAATAPVSGSVTAPNDAVWSVPIANPSGSVLSGVTATLDANANGSTPLGFNETLMTFCDHGGGSTETCNLPDIPAHSTYLFNVLVPTTGLAAGTVVTGNIDAAVSGQPDTFGGLSPVTVASCGAACVQAVALPGVPTSSSSAPPSTAHPTTQSITLPADQPGSPAQAPIAITLNSIAPAAAPVADRSLCPITGTATRCAGQISVVTGDFSSFTDKAHPVSIKIVAKWASVVPAGKILMKKDIPGPPIQLPMCVRNATTLKYNTPCARPQFVAGSAAAHNLTTTNVILLNGNDVHFARRVVVGPNAPTLVKAVAGVKKAIVSWKVPTVTNGAITGYSVTAYISGVAKKTVLYKSALLKETMTGLLTGKTYTFKVVARNAKGTSLLSIASNSVKPT